MRGFRLANGLILTKGMRSQRVIAPNSRWMSSAKAELDPNFLKAKNKQTDEKLKALGKKSWWTWAKERSDELQVVVLWGLVMVTTLQSVRLKGEHREDEKIWQEEKAELEAKLERLKSETRASVSEGAAKLASDFGIKAKKAEELRGAMLALVDNGIAKVTPAKNANSQAEEEYTIDADTPKTSTAPAPRKLGGLV